MVRLGVAYLCCISFVYIKKLNLEIVSELAKITKAIKKD